MPEILSAVRDDNGYSYDAAEFYSDESLRRSDDDTSLALAHFHSIRLAHGRLFP